MWEQWTDSKHADAPESPRSLPDMITSFLLLMDKIWLTSWDFGKCQANQCVAPREVQQLATQKRTRLRGKHRLPIIGRTVKFRGCKHLNWFRRNLPINSMLFLKFTHTTTQHESKWCKTSVRQAELFAYKDEWSSNVSRDSVCTKILWKILWKKKMSSQNGKDQHVYFVLSSPRVSGELCLIYHNPSRIPGFLGSPDERNFFQVKGGQSESNFGRSP